MNYVILSLLVVASCWGRNYEDTLFNILRIWVGVAVGVCLINGGF